MAYSEPGQGTTFSIYLPRYGGPMAPAPTASGVEPLVGGKETILLVEDEPMILTITTALLEYLGYTVLAPSSPGEAIRMAGEHSSEIHLLLTDVIMPEMNGKDLAARLRPDHPHLKCLFMSGYTSDVIAQHGILDEGVQFIQKPFSIKDLAIKVRAVLELH
jgi:CheY-like chemotaxis protein